MTEKDAVCASWRKKEPEYDLSPERYAQIEEDIRYIGEMCHDDDDEF